MIVHARRTPFAYALSALSLTVCASFSAHAAPNDPVYPAQRETARHVAEAGVPLSELAPDAPDQHVVRRGDTLWDISSLFLRSPWRWPELWGMNLEQIRNPHLIYPGQRLVLVRSGGRARLQVAGPVGVSGDGRLSPRARGESVGPDAITSIPMHLIRPFLNEAVILDAADTEHTPRIVAGREGRRLLGMGDIAYVRGDLAPVTRWRIYRNPRALKDPVSQEILGYEAAYVGTADYRREGEEVSNARGEPEVVPATFVITATKQEAGAGDRLTPAVDVEEPVFVPHAPQRPVDGRIISIYGAGLTAGAHQIVALNVGRRDGIEQGHVLRVLQSGETVVDRDDPRRPTLKLPDEIQGSALVFRVFDRLSYALMVQASGPVRAGDRIAQP